MGIETLQLLSVVHFPELDRAIFAGTDQYIGIRPPGQAADRTFVSNQIEIQPTCIGFPDMQSTRPVTGRNQNAIRTEVNCINPVRVFLQFECCLLYTSDAADE